MADEGLVRIVMEGDVAEITGLPELFIPVSLLKEPRAGTYYLVAVTGFVLPETPRDYPDRANFFSMYSGPSDGLRGVPASHEISARHSSYLHGGANYHGVRFYDYFTFKTGDDSYAVIRNPSEKNLGLHPDIVIYEQGAHDKPSQVRDLLAIPIKQIGRA